MKDKNLGELVKVCSEILKSAKKHYYLWNNANLWKDNDRTISLFGGFIAQDEYYSFNLKRYNLTFGFLGSNCPEKELITDPLEAATVIDCYNIPAEKIRDNFYKQLKEPLGRYLAEEYLKDKWRKNKDVISLEGL